MGAPTTVEGFVEDIRKSGLLGPGVLVPYLEAARAGGGLPDSPKSLARALVKDGQLTFLQAEQLLLGRWKHLFVGGKYKVLERLGEGGMASVFLCEHQMMRRLVALKILPSVGADDPATLERFYREARAAARLRHPNIVGAHDVDRHGSSHFLVMEYVDGCTLEEAVAHHGPLDPVRAAHYISQAAIGLHHAHESGLVHRDIKPSNLLLDRHGTVKLLDLGLARLQGDETDGLTRRVGSDLILGTLDYLAPEQALDSHDVDIRADIYSLGATFYFLLSGRSPFQDGTSAQKLAGHLHRRPRPLTEFRADVPPRLIDVLDAMMAKEPASRPQAPIEVVEALSPWTESPIPPLVVDVPRRLSPAARSTIQQATLRSPAASSLTGTSGARRGLPDPSDVGKARPIRRRRGASVAVATAAGVLVAAGLGLGYGLGVSRIARMTGLGTVAAAPIAVSGRSLAVVPPPRGGIDRTEADAPFGAATEAALAGRWAEAAEGFAAAVAAAPADPEARYRLAIALLAAGNVEGYRRACAGAVERLGDSSDPRICDRVASMCVAAPDAVPDLAGVVRVARRAALASSEAGHLLGAALVRDGRAADAAEILGAGRSRARDYLFLAMIHHELGRREEADRHLATAKRWIDGFESRGSGPAAEGWPNWPSWTDRAEALILLREAQALLEPSGARRSAPGSSDEDRPIAEAEAESPTVPSAPPAAT